MKNKKYTKILITIIMSFSLIFPIFSNLSFAQNDNIENIDNLSNILKTEAGIDENFQYKKSQKPKRINPVRYKKINIRKYDERSPYYKVSASAAKGFTISTNSSKAFGVIVEGAIKGLGFGLNYVLSSSTSYTVTNNVYNMAHIGCRVVYEVEKGTRVYYNAQNNKELGRNAYTYKKPKTIEYDLIKVY